MTGEAREIARHLTQGQRDYLLGRLPNLRPQSEDLIKSALARLNLAEWSWALNETGLAVRAELERQEQPK